MTIPLARVITRFQSEFLARYQHQLLPSQFKALKAMQACRSSLSAQMLAQCTRCGQQRLVPHSCGHRSCPHCQHFESQRWIERQTQALLPGTYFLITFTLPQELRGLAWSHQQTVYSALMQCAWETVAQFSRNHHQLKGQVGAVDVLHTHSRRLEFHPHVHLAMPAVAGVNDPGRSATTILAGGRRGMNGWCCSTSCPRDCGARATLAWRIPIASTASG